MEITKLLNGTTESDLKTSHKIMVDWDQLTEAIEKAVMLRNYETIKGLAINEEGITVYVAQKPGRKVTTKADE